MAQSIEEPGYTTLDNIGVVEIRQYDPVIQAVTTLESSKSTTSGFKRLAGFIFGENESGESISMTAPVQEALWESQPQMAFTMPSIYTLEDLPQPNSSEVQLYEVPERTVAVIQFSGWATGSKIKRMTQTLEQTLAQENIEVSGEWSLNQYNPPWTPPFMRRNEIWVEIGHPAKLIQF